jgi:hypothetical protein
MPRAKLASRRTAGIPGCLCRGGLPLRIVRDELGLTTGVINPQRSGKRSRALDATFFKQLREQALRQCQFPPVLTDTAGRSIHRPPDW